MENLAENIGLSSGIFSALCELNGMVRGFVVVISMRCFVRMNILDLGIGLKRRLVHSEIACKTVSS
jgi:hypothetical protein